MYGRMTDSMYFIWQWNETYGKLSPKQIERERIEYCDKVGFTD